MPVNKKLGQHWLQDSVILEKIASYAELNSEDFVVEVGPGLGTLTAKLLKSNATVLAVEFDQKLAENLPKSFPGKPNLKVQNSDIRRFNFEELTEGFKLVTNLPYYISGIFFRILTETKNKPALTVVLVQQEVAEKMACSPEVGESNKLAMLVAYHYETSLGVKVPPKAFNPPPKVNSRVIVLKKRQAPLFPNLDFKTYSRLVRFAFSSPRKTLINNLAAGLHKSKSEVTELISHLKLHPELRAEQLELHQWEQLFAVLSAHSL